MKFKIYQLLDELSQKLRSNSDNLFVNYEVCWEYTSPLTEAIRSDISSLINQSCFVTSVRFYLDDQTYRQSASGCIAEIKFDQEDEFTLSLECLIDFGLVLLWVKQSPSELKYAAITELIEAKYNAEFKADLKSL